MKSFIVSEFDGAYECQIDVREDEGPREAAESFAAIRPVLPRARGRVVFVRPIECEVGTYWRVEVVSAYRARPA